MYPGAKGSSQCESMGEGYCIQSYPYIYKEVVSGFKSMTNQSPRHNFTVVPGLAVLNLIFESGNATRVIIQRVKEFLLLNL